MTPGVGRTEMMKGLASIAMCVAVCGCAYVRPESHRAGADYLFVELKTENADRVVKRPDSVFDTAMIRRCLDFPTYRFEERFGILRGAFDFDEETPFVGILGKSHSLRGTGTGTASRLYPIDGLPFTKGSLTVQRIDADGTVRGILGTNSFCLAPGQEISRQSVTNRIESGTEYEVTDTITVVNHGLQKRDKVVWYDPHYSKLRNEEAQPATAPYSEPAARSQKR